MNVLLLAGGLGPRLRPLTETVPKPMAPVGNRPWLEHLIIHLKNQGIKRFVIALKHYPEVVQRYFGTGDQWGIKIQYAIETSLLGTAGAIKHAEPYLDDRFLVVNADIIHDIDILPLLEFHNQHDGLVTIGLTEVEDPSHYGVVEQDESGRILRFIEKPPKDEVPSNRINAGIYVMDKEVLQYIPKDREVSIERETFPLLIREGMGVYGSVISSRYWKDMGTRDRYRQVHWDLLDRTLNLPMPGNPRGKGIWMGEDCEIGPGALLVPPVLIGNGVKIGERSIIGPYAVIGDHSTIGKQVRCAETIMWDHCSVQDGSVLNHCIFGSKTLIGTHYVLHEAVISRNGVMQA